MTIVEFQFGKDSCIRACVVIWIWRIRPTLIRVRPLSPYCNLKSMYFDDSLYENEMHYKLDKLKDEFPLEDDWSEVRIKAANETEYNEILDKLYHYTKDRIRIFGVSNNPMEIIVEKDPRENYRQFDEEKYLVDEKTHTESQT